MNVAFLVVGDPFAATTHSDLYLRAKRMQVDVSVIHNVSIMNAIGCCGLQLYHFGPTVSIPFFTESWKPASFYDKIRANKTLGWHTLCLLDIKVKEQSEENLFKGRKIYEPSRFMSVKHALKQLYQIEQDRKEGVASDDAIAVAMLRIGSSTQKIIAGTIRELLDAEEGIFGEPLHSLIIPGNMHELELEMLRQFFIDKNKND